MRTRLECIPCVFRQALSAAQRATPDPAVHERVLRAMMEAYRSMPLSHTPAWYSQRVYEIVAQVTGAADPFAEEKHHFNRIALAMAPACAAAIAAAADPLATGAHLAVAGNIIDLGITERLDISGTLASALHTPFAVSDLEHLRAGLASARALLYIGDNAGEIVFDRIFIETLRALHPGLAVVFAVKSGPVINDATMDDARAVGMLRVCEVIETGGAWVGAPLERVSAEFRERFERADLVIAKGQGNFETLSDCRDKNIYFILKAKCAVVARALGVAFGDSVLRHVARLPREEA